MLIQKPYKGKQMRNFSIYLLLLATFSTFCPAAQADDQCNIKEELENQINLLPEDDFTGRLEVAKTWLNSHQNDAETCFYIGTQYANHQEPAKALEYFTKATALDGYVSKYFEQKIECEAKLSKWQYVKADANHLLKLDNTSEKGKYWLKTALDQLKQNKQASGK